MTFILGIALCLSSTTIPPLRKGHSKQPVTPKNNWARLAARPHRLRLRHDDAEVRHLHRQREARLRRDRAVLVHPVHGVEEPVGLVVPAHDVEVLLGAVRAPDDDGGREGPGLAHRAGDGLPLEGGGRADPGLGELDAGVEVLRAAAEVGRVAAAVDDLLKKKKSFKLVETSPMILRHPKLCCKIFK